MKDKITFLIIPFLVLFFGLIIGYTFLNWLFFVKLEIFAVKTMIVNFVIPFVLILLFGFFLFPKRLKILNLQAEKGDWSNFYMYIFCTIFLVPLIISQEYLISATGKLTELESINDVYNKPTTKYYILNNHFIDKKAVGIHTDLTVTGKRNNDFNMFWYMGIPIFESSKDTLQRLVRPPRAWVGIKYMKTIENSLSRSEKNRIYQEFSTESQASFEIEDFSQFSYLERVDNSDLRDDLLLAVGKNPYYLPTDLVFQVVHQPFELRNGTKLNWIIGSSIIGILVFFLMISIPKIDKRQLKRIKAGKPDKEAQRDNKETLRLLIPKGDYFITPIIIYLNVLVFILMAISSLRFYKFQGSDLLLWGANFKPYTIHGEWWRLLTNTFIHGGITHLILNIMALLFAGIFLEPVLGRTKFLMAYLLSGILASCASLWWYDATISVGASGAIFGLYGVFLSFFVNSVSVDFRNNPLLISVLVFVGFNLLMGITGGIDNAAHVGGLISGFVIGFFIRPSVK